MIFLKLLVTTTWGICVLTVVSATVWVMLSALLYRPFFKRFYDVVLSGIALILLSPIFLILAIMIRVKLGAPIIFKQFRPGKKGKIFTMRKFRTMTSAKDSNGNLLPDEQRMTAFGKMLRSTSLDELPEIWNIFIGQMSIIGPRPQLIKDLVFMDESIKLRHKVRGGLTGLAQVSGRNNLTWEQRLMYDIQYVKRITLWGDLVLFFKTIGKVFAKADIETAGMSTSEDYGDYLLRTEQVTQEYYEEKMLEAKLILDGLRS